MSVSISSIGTSEFLFSACVSSRCTASDRRTSKSKKALKQVLLIRDLVLPWEMLSHTSNFRFSFTFDVVRRWCSLRETKRRSGSRRRLQTLSKASNLLEGQHRTTTGYMRSVVSMAGVAECGKLGSKKGDSAGRRLENSGPASARWMILKGQRAHHGGTRARIG